MAVKANDLAIKALKPRMQRYEVAVRDHRGLIVCVWPSGARTFLLRYRQDGTLKRATLSATTLAAARKEWETKRDDVKRGEDPVAVVKAARAGKQLKRQEERAAPTVETLGHEYIKRYAKQKKKSWRSDELMLEAAVFSEWGKIKARDLKRRDVIALIDSIAERTPVRANRVLAVIRKMFNWAVERDILEHSPCAGVKPPGAEQSRERVLTSAELKAFWNGLPESDLDLFDQAALKLQLLTGARIGEVVGASWSEFDLKEGQWLIPGKRSKNKRESLVPLSPTALAVLAELPHESEFVFPRNSQTQHTRIDVITHNLRQALPAFGTERFTSHDLRRTAATRLAELGTPRVVIGAVLNHVDRSVGGIYDRHNYANEKRAALEAWAKRLGQIASAEEPSGTSSRLARHRPVGGAA